MNGQRPGVSRCQCYLTKVPSVPRYKLLLEFRLPVFHPQPLLVDLQDHVVSFHCSPQRKISCPLCPLCKGNSAVPCAQRPAFPWCSTTTQRKFCCPLCATTRVSLVLNNNDPHFTPLPLSFQENTVFRLRSFFPLGDMSKIHLCDLDVVAVIWIPGFKLCGVMMKNILSKQINHPLTQ